MILADDFTGACDAAGAFGASRRTRMVYALPRQWPVDVEVLAVDLDLRDRSDEESHAEIARAAARLSDDARVFVKIDSTLRGPIAGLVGGALAGSRARVAMIAPAFPEQGRFLRGGAALVETLRGLSATVVDADSTEALRGLAEQWEEHTDWLLVGSAGLTRQLAQPGQSSVPDVPDGLPLLVIAGSPAAATREQLARLDELEDVVVLSTPPAADRDLGEAAAKLAEQVAAWAETNRPRAVVLTGGATARAVCHRLQVDSLEIHGEVSPGIPHGVLQGGRWHGLRVVTKAGGFGTSNTLLDLAHALGVSSNSSCQ